MQQSTNLDLSYALVSCEVDAADRLGWSMGILATSLCSIMACQKATGEGRAAAQENWKEDAILFPH